MTKEEIMKLAREAGLVRTGDGWTEPHRWGMAELKAFADLVAAHKAEVALAEAYRCGYEAGVVEEREACAKVCDEAHELMNSSFQGAAVAIRARGCWECGERWELGSASTCKCKELVKKREWVGLTDDEREAIANSTIRIHGQEWAYATAIEAKLKERNT